MSEGWTRGTAVGGDVLNFFMLQHSYYPALRMVIELALS